MAQYDTDKLMKIFGTDELVQAFVEMERTLQNTILTKSFKQAAKLIISEAQGGLTQYKYLYPSFGTKFTRSDQTLDVGVKGGWAWIANYGTKPRLTKGSARKSDSGGFTKARKIHSTGKIVGSFYFTRALESTEEQVQEIIYTNIEEHFNKLIQKNNIQK